MRRRPNRPAEARSEEPHLGGDEGEKLESHLPCRTWKHGSPAAQGLRYSALALQSLRVLQAVEPLQHVQLFRKRRH